MDRDTFDIYEYIQQRPALAAEGKVSQLTLAKGEYIYNPPQNVGRIFLIKAGVVKIGSYSLKGNEVVYDVLVTGDTFGNLRFLEREFNEFAKAITPLEYYSFDLAFFRRIIVEDHTISEWFNYNVVKRWCKSEARLFSIAANDVATRIVNLFQELHPHYEKNNINFELLLTQQDIADLVGATRQTVARAVKKLRAENEDVFLTTPIAV